MRYKSLLGGAAHFAGMLVKDPGKTIKDTIRGIRFGPEGGDKILAPLAGVGGLTAIFVGVASGDPLLIGIGATFAATAGGIYQNRGEEMRGKVETAPVEAKPAPEPVKESTIRDAGDAREHLEKVLGKEIEATPSLEAEARAAPTRTSFKPNLPRPGGPESHI